MDANRRHQLPRRSTLGAAVVLFVSVVIVASAAPAYAAAPANDNRAAAELLTASVTGRSLLDATAEPGEVLTCGADTYSSTVWFRYVAPAGGSVTLRVPTAARSMSLYRADGSRARCGSDALTVEVAQGEQILIQIGRLPSAIGYNYSLEVSFAGRPANDNQASAALLNAGDQSLTTSLLGATTQPGEALSCNSDTYDHTVWFRYVAPAAGSVVVRLTTGGAAVSVYRTGRDRLCSLGGIASYGVRAGEALIIQVGRRPTATSYIAGLRVTLTPAPAHDQRATPLDLPGLKGTITGTLAQATTEPGERVACRGTTLSSTLWFRFVAPARGNAVFASGVNNRAVAVYRANRVSCDFSRVSLRGIRAGEPLLVQLGRRPAATGYNFTLTYRFAPDPDQDGDGYSGSSSGGADCDDANPRINPDQRDRPGNGIDENCDGSDAVGQTNVGMKLWDLHVEARNGRKLPPSKQTVVGIDKLTFKNLPPRSKLRLSCRGGGCLHHLQTRRFPRGRRTLVIRRPLRRQDKQHDAFKTVVLEARIVQPKLIGQVSRWVVTRGKPKTAIHRSNLCATATGPVRRCP